MLSELESQNDQQVEGILGKVKVLKEVGSRPSLMRPALLYTLRSMLGAEIKA